MTEREILIINAATKLFLRYGVKRTGMKDIADEADVSRQTLYKTFPNKAAVLKGTIRLMAERAIDRIETDMCKVSDLGGKLDVIFKHVAIEHFDLLNSSPNAGDILSGFNETSQEELEAGAKRNTKLIARIMSPYREAVEGNCLTVDQLADFVQRSVSAAKYNATSRKHLFSMLAVLRVSVLKVTSNDKCA